MPSSPVIGMMAHIFTMAPNMDLSVVYPVHITFATRYILKRIIRCLSNTTQGLPDAEHLVVLSGKPRYVSQAKQLIKASQLSIKILDYTSSTAPYSPGTARNFAVKHTTTKHLLFWDIDLLGSSQLYDAIPNQLSALQQDKNAFEMYPCLYLCSEYTNQFQGKTKQDFDQAWTDATNLKTNSIEHFAMATSTVLCNKHHFLEIGAFDEGFVGHMGEDLELLNRLSIAYGKYPFETDHAENHPSKIPAQLKGFRKHFLNYTVAHLDNNLFTTHLHHNTHLGSNYKKKNNENINLLLKKLKNKAHQKTITFNLALPSYLRSAPSVKLSSAQLFRKKLRKLIMDPKQFFKDIN